ncbi:DUF4188 domain-containing protein [Rhodococcus sp. IEGM 1379]|uniref:DUF4188 domain-containing protein n=1 Tax=Rhodococcus sp. IEGM 1379 TaxID=3047086 RepID=UPI0024B7C3DE|nr:DUF4188 domain-containing protein [Rhodococcus sp. IEGM 1379]MDI9915447.1 DUF4188 domain-containing protein [Rhodococcus sp. IEGM 1379]
MVRHRVQTGRYTAKMDDEFVVFLIGMRVNKLWKIHRWIGPFLAMPRMLRQLQRHPDKGLLGARMSLGGRTITVIQYWRSFDQLEAFAKNPNDPHLPAWKAFNKNVGSSGDVGVYHETYRIDAGQYESIYSNMPIMGLAAAGSSVAVGKRSETARARITK